MADHDGGNRERWSVRIARVAGIDIRVHVSFLLIVLLFGFGTGRGGLDLVARFGWLAIIFAGVLVHELAHSIVARRRGATVNAIVLLPIGGVSKIERIPEGPGNEFAISIAGPAVSVAIGGVAAAIALLAGTPMLPVDLYDGPLVPRIAWLNLTLGAFNMLPAFPMDGGRVLRAVIERWRGRASATKIAAATGRVLALGMVAAGLAWNPWLIVIAVFVYLGASGEESATLVQEALGGLRVRDVMLERPVTVSADTAMGDLKPHLRVQPQRDFPVTLGGRYLGMLAAEQIEEAAPEAVALDLAVRGVPIVAPEQPLEGEPIGAFSGGERTAIPVVEDGAVVGLLRRDDVARVLRHPPRSAAA